MPEAGKQALLLVGKEQARMKMQYTFTRKGSWLKVAVMMRCRKGSQA